MEHPTATHYTERTANMSEETGVAKRGDAGMLAVAEVMHQINEIQHLMKQAMHDGEHYGTIPGCGPKPTLLKPGAEKLCMMFRLGTEYDITLRELSNNHREYQIVCTLHNIVSGAKIGQGVGCCSTMEVKYRYRQANRKCPECGQEAIIKGKEEYGGGWLCFKKKGGCGAKWPNGEEQIEKQEVSKIENPDIADTYNTVLKISKKRAHVDAVLTATAASDIFAQDLEDMAHTESANPTESKGDGMANEAQRKLIRSKQTKLGVSDAVLKKIIFEVAGAKSSKELPADKVDAILKELDKHNDLPY